jgi:fructose-bisphosphate aldolase/2-amino-3,7-dideoxy-D-threo-hept-6-ulosonate synthase
MNDLVSGSRKRQNRLEKFLKSDGRTLVVAFDHALSSGPTSGSESVDSTLNQVIEGGADGILLNPGTIKRFGNLLRDKLGIIMSIPNDPAFVKYASFVDAAGVKTTCFGDVFDNDSIKKQQEIALACEEYDMPYVAEIVPATREGGVRKVINDNWLVQVAARKAAEIGADLVKTIYTGDQRSFRKVVTSTFIPVVILGGEKLASDRAILELAKESVDAGGSGVAFGRNIWKNQNPSGIIKSLKGVIHQNMQVDDALDLGS